MDIADAGVVQGSTILDDALSRRGYPCFQTIYLDGKIESLQVEHIVLEHHHMSCHVSDFVNCDSTPISSCFKESRHAQSEAISPVSSLETTLNELSLDPCHQSHESRRLLQAGHETVTGIVSPLTQNSASSQDIVPKLSSRIRKVSTMRGKRVVFSRCQLGGE